MRRSWIAVIAVASCSPAAPPQAPDTAAQRCDDVVAKAIERVYPDHTPTVEVIEAVKIRRCRADGWASEALACYASAGSVGALRDCRGKLRAGDANRLDAQEAQIRNDWEQLLAEHEETRDRMCGCTDRACAVRVGRRAEAWERDAPRRSAGRRAGAPPDVDERIHKSDDAMRACETRLGANQLAAAIAAMRDFADKMCACSDQACAVRVSDEMTKWGQEQARSGDSNLRPSDEDAKQFAEVTKRMADCMQGAMRSAP
jgi:hypothetical protein